MARLNTTRTQNRRKKYFEEKMIGKTYNPETGKVEEMSDAAKAWRDGFDKGAKSYHNDVKYSLGYKEDEKLPKGKVIDVDLFDIKTQNQ